MSRECFRFEGLRHLYWLRFVLFLLIVPCTVMLWAPIGLVLWLGPGEIGLGALRFAGVLPLLGGVGLFIWTVYDFLTRGKGTPSPYDPPQVLVVTGPFRWVRNPMYLAVLTVLVGETMLLDSTVLSIHLACTALFFLLGVQFWEEPGLRRRFGSAYDEYCREVPRWLPKKPRRDG